MIDPIEKRLFLEGIYQKFGYDFRNYAEASIERRLRFIMDVFEVKSLLELLHMVFHSQTEFKKLLNHMTIHTTEFFRDPSFFKTIREEVVPILKTYNSINVWHAGCSTGEEVISLAILFKEEGLDNKTTVYATDISENALKTARKATYDLSKFKDLNKNYVASGGTETPSQYYTAEYGLGRFDPSLIKNVVFSTHNLATDGNFIEAHLIICRNVIIYFDSTLQDRVFRLFANSLANQGILGLGPKESVQFSAEGKLYTPLKDIKGLYHLRRVGR